MAQVNKISSFKSFTEVKNQENTMKLRETNNAKRQETIGKIGAILDEMGLTSLSELDEEKKQALINKMFGNVSEDEAEDIEDELNKLGEPKNLEEGNAFIYAAAKAKNAGKKTFSFNGKTYKVTLKTDTGLKEGNDFEEIESIDEARSISKIQYDWSKLTTQMQATAQNWKAAEGSAKEMLLGKLKEMTAQKKAIEAELDAAIADKDKDLELVVTEAFFRLPKDVIGNELYLATQNLSNLYGRTLAGNDIDAGVIDTIIKALTTVKKSVKKFNSKEEVLGTVYEGKAKDLKPNHKYTSDYGEVTFIKLNPDGKTMKLHSKETGEIKTDISNAYNMELIESVVNEAEKFKSTKDFEEFCEEIDGMPEVRIKRIMGKDYIDTPGGYRDEAEDYDNDIIEYMISNMGKSDFNELKTWWENNVAESTVTESGYHRSAPSAEATRKAEQLKKLKKLRDHREETDRIKKAQLKRAKATGSAKESIVTEAEVKSDDEFKEYAMAVLKKAFGEDFDEAKAGEVVDGILKKCDGDYGAAVGMLTSSLGESVTNEAFDADKRVIELAKLLKKQKFVGSVYPEGDTIKVFVDSDDLGTTMMWDDNEPGKVRMECEDDSYSETIDDNNAAILNFFENLDDEVNESITNEEIDTKYWADYNTSTSGQGNKEFANKSKDFEDTFSLAVSEWNAEAEGAENRIKGAQISKIKKLAQEFFKKEAYISVNIIQAMIAQES